MALMKAIQWVKIFQKGKPVYTMADLAKLSGLSLSALRKSVARLVKQGILVPLKAEVYANGFHPPSFEEAACLAYPPCYISGETALFRAGILEQSPFDLTCVTLNKTKTAETPMGQIHYQHIKEELFFGYEREKSAFWAWPEKALLDYAYLRRKRGETVLLDGLNLELLSKKRLKVFLKKFPRSVQAYFAKNLGRRFE